MKNLARSFLTNEQLEQKIVILEEKIKNLENAILLLDSKKINKENYGKEEETEAPANAEAIEKQKEKKKREAKIEKIQKQFNVS